MSLRAIRFPPSILFHRRSILIFVCMLLLTEGQTGEIWELSKGWKEVWKQWIEKYFHFCVSKGLMRKDCTPSDERLPAGHDEENPQLPESKRESSRRLVTTTVTFSQNAIHRNTPFSKKWPFYCFSLLLCWVRGSEPKWHRNRDTKGGRHETWKRNYEKW